LLEVIVTGLPARGALTLDGIAVAAQQAIPVGAIAAGGLRFTPAADESGAGYASLAFRVRDDGGTANGGADLAAAAATLAIDVRAVNDAPVLRAVADLQVGEGDRVSVQLTATDVDSPPPYSFALEEGPAGAAIDSTGRLTWSAGDGDKDYRFAVRATDTGGASDLTRFVVRVLNVAPTVQIVGSPETRVGIRYEVALRHADPGSDAVLSMSIDWGDGVVDALAADAARAVHVYAKPIDQAAIRVTVIDKDGTWRILAPYTLAVMPGYTGVTGIAVDIASRAPASEAPPPPLVLATARAPGVAFDLSSTLIGQTAHPHSQPIGFAVVESVPTNLTLPPGPLTAEAMAALIESAPTAAGQPPTLHVRSAVSTGGGLRVRFSQELSIAALVGTARSGEPLRSGDVVVLRNGVPVQGQLVLDPDGEGFLFMPEGGILRDGEYSLTLRTGNGSFVSRSGQVLDGDHDGRPGGDFRARFIVSRPVSLGVASGADDAAIERSTGLPWHAQGSTGAADATDSLWSLIGGLGGAATMMTSLGPWGVPGRAARAGTGRRVAADERRRAARALDAAPIKLHTELTTFDHGGEPLTGKTSGWVSRWLGKAQAKGNEWRIRL
jgi:hypothetical protein